MNFARERIVAIENCWGNPLRDGKEGNRIIEILRKNVSG